LPADVDDLPRARLLRVEAVDHVRTAIEDEVLAGGGLLETGRVAELAGDVRRHGAGRLQEVGLDRAGRGDEKKHTTEDAESAEDHMCSLYVGHGFSRAAWHR